MFVGAPVWISPIIILWSRKYDKAYGFLAQRERGVAAKFRKKKLMTKADLAAVVEWKFKDEPEKKTRGLELVQRNSDEAVERISSHSLQCTQMPMTCTA